MQTATSLAAQQARKELPGGRRRAAAAGCIEALRRREFINFIG